MVSGSIPVHNHEPESFENSLDLDSRANERMLMFEGEFAMMLRSHVNYVRMRHHMYLKEKF